jgi:hypothetical protein
MNDNKDFFGFFAGFGILAVILNLLLFAGVIWLIVWAVKALGLV